MFQKTLVSSPTNGNTSFVTGSVGGTSDQSCIGSAAGSGITNSGATLMACSGTPITGMVLSGGASGGTVTIYDANTNLNNTSFLAEVSVQEVVFEATVAASTQLYIDMSDAPIMTQNGVVVLASSTSGVVVYTGSQGKVN